MNFTNVTGNYNNSGNISQYFLQDFNIPNVGYLIVLMATGFTYYIAQKNMSLALLIGTIVSLLLYAVQYVAVLSGVVGINIISFYFVSLITVTCILYFAFKYKK